MRQDGRRTAVVFGASGQDGRYLIELCERRGIDAVGVSRSSGPCRGDVGDAAFVEGLLHRLRPDLVFQLAARSSTDLAAVVDNHRAISGGTWNVLAAAERRCPDARIFVCGSGLQFRNDGRPVRESDRFEPSSGYAIERIHAAHAARYFRRRGLRTYVGYLFHHDSPLRGDEWVAQRLARAARRIADGSRERVEVGDLSVEREWTFAGDVVEAILTLVEQNDVTEAVIGSGEAHSIADWAEACFAACGLDWRRHVGEQDGFAASFRRLVCDPSTIRGLGWAPRVAMPELARMMVGVPTRAPAAVH